MRGTAEVRWGPPGAVFLEKSFLVVFGLRSAPDGSGQVVGFSWFLFRAKPSMLDPFRTKFDVFGPDRNFGQLGLDLTGTLDTRSEAALEVTNPNQTQN